MKNRAAYGVLVLDFRLRHKTTNARMHGINCHECTNILPRKLGNTESHRKYLKYLNI